MVFSGVSKSVCGMEWLLEYLKRLTSDEKLNVKHELGNCSYQFSHTGILIPSIQQVTLPQIMINNKNYCLEIGVVAESIPLLLAESEVLKHQEINKKSVHDIDKNINHTTAGFSAQKEIDLLENKEKWDYQNMREQSAKTEKESILKGKHSMKMSILKMIQHLNKINCKYKERLTTINVKTLVIKKCKSHLKIELKRKRQWKKRKKIKTSKVKFIRKKKKCLLKMINKKETSHIIKINKQKFKKANESYKKKVISKSKMNHRNFTGKRSRWKRRKFQEYPCSISCSKERRNKINRSNKMKLRKINGQKSAENRTRWKNQKEIYVNQKFLVTL